MITTTVSAAGIAAASDRIAPYVRVTPVLRVVVPTPTGPRLTVLKLESLQITGSFKSRGAFNSLLQLDASGVVAVSGGNHGLAVAHAAHVLGRRATIVVPVSAAVTKVEAMRRVQATVVQHGDVPAEAFAFAERIIAEHGWPLIHPYDQVATVTGQGTIGPELLEQAPEVTHWLMAVGGGGFAGGAAVAMDGRAQVVPVEPYGCPGLHQAQAAGGPVPVGAAGDARNSLGAPSIGLIPWELLRHRVPTCVLVTDGDIVAAQRWLWNEVRVVAEPGGAAGLAALMSGAWAPAGDSTNGAVPGAVPGAVGVVVCGGNADALPT